MLPLVILVIGAAVVVMVMMAYTPIVTQFAINTRGNVTNSQVISTTQNPQLVTASKEDPSHTASAANDNNVNTYLEVIQ